MKIKYASVAIDDDALFLDIFEFLAHQVECLELIQTYTDWKDASVGLMTHKPDILFLDIEMPGFDYEEITRNFGYLPKIVVVSAHLHFDISKLNFKVTKFVSKPIRDSRHLESIVREVMDINQLDFCTHALMAKFANKN